MKGKPTFFKTLQVEKFDIENILKNIENKNSIEVIEYIKKYTSEKGFPHNPGLPTIVRFLEEAQKNHLIKNAESFIKIDQKPKQKIGKESLIDRIEKNKLMDKILKNTFGLSPEEAINKIEKLSDNKIKTTSSSYIKMILLLIEQKKAKEGHVIIPPKKEKKSVTKAQRKEDIKDQIIIQPTFPMTLKCNECGAKQGYNISEVDCFGREMNQYLVALRCHKCGIWGNFTTTTIAYDKTFFKSLVDGKEEFVNENGKIIKNPLMK